MEPVSTGILSSVGGASGLGSLLGGAGQLLGGLGFGKKKGPTPEEQSAVQLKHEVDSFHNKMSLAKQHGLHPLSVLGVPMATFTPSVSQDVGYDLAQMGAGANQLSKAFASTQEDKTEAPVTPLAAAQLRLVEAQAKKAEWDALGAEFAAADRAAPPILLGQPGNPPGVRRSNDVVQMENLVAEQSGIPPSYLSGGQSSPVEVSQKVAPPHPRDVGYAAATDQAWGKYIDRDGKIGSFVRPEVQQTDIEKGATFQYFAKLFGVERAMQITALLENEHLLMGGSVAASLLLRRPVGAILKKFEKKPPYKPNWKGGK